MGEGVLYSLTHISLPWWEFVLRALVVYVFLLVALRLTGKRQVGQLTPFDLVLLLILSNAVQNSMNGGDNSLLGGLISAVSLVALNSLVGRVISGNRKLERMVDGQPRVLISDSHVYHAVMVQEGITRDELMAALRKNGCDSVDQVRLAVLETNGSISVIKHD
ncbi:MAG: YetF domain-containing protein [Dongiaceae bacterium]